MVYFIPACWQTEAPTSKVPAIDAQQKNVLDGGRKGRTQGSRISCAQEEAEAIEQKGPQARLGRLRAAE